MPIIFCICLFALGSHFANKKKKSTQDPQMQIELDEEMPPSIRIDAIDALFYEKSPQKLYSFAEAIKDRFPKTAYQLRCQAWVLDHRRGPCPTYQEAA